AGTSPFAAVVGDYNGDGISDLAVSNTGSNNVTLLLGNGDGTFQPGASYAAGTSPAYLAVTDLNGDQKQDLLMANSGSNNVSVLLGNAATTTATLQSYPNPAKPGQTVTFKAIVRVQSYPYFGLPGGTVTFADAGIPMPGGTVPLNGTSALFTILTLSVGTHSITAAYSGDAKFAAITSAALNEVVR